MDIIENSHLRGIVVAITMKYHIPIVGTGCLANVLGSDLLESLVFKGTNVRRDLKLLQQSKVLVAMIVKRVVVLTC